MEVVLLLVAIVGIALIAVPRLKRRRTRPVAPRRKRRVAVAASAPAATWSAPDDGWDDDLGWEGTEDGPAPEAREAWDRFRASAAPAPEPEVPELPSVERW